MKLRNRDSTEHAEHPTPDDDVMTHRDQHDSEDLDRHRGLNGGAAFFGWLVAVAMTGLLVAIVGAVAAGVGSSMDLTMADAEQQADRLGIATASLLLAILLIGYFCGGYVAGRMSRFNGAKQGLGVWLFGVLISIVVGALSALFGSQYDILARIELPSISVSSETLTIGGLIALGVVLLGTLVAALAGGRVGTRYHHKIDRSALYY